MTKSFRIDSFVSPDPERASTASRTDSGRPPRATCTSRSTWLPSGPSSASNAVVPTTTGNSLPDSTDDSYSVDEDDSLVVNAVLGVLANDSDLNGDAMSAEEVTGPTNGVLTLNGDGSFTYTPDTDFNGLDTFTYTASDSVGPGFAATVTITVDAVNDVPSFTGGPDVVASPADGVKSIIS